MKIGILHPLAPLHPPAPLIHQHPSSHSHPPLFSPSRSLPPPFFLTHIHLPHVHSRTSYSELREQLSLPLNICPPDKAANRDLNTIWVCVPFPLKDPIPNTNCSRSSLPLLDSTDPPAPSPGQLASPSLHSTSTSFSLSLWSSRKTNHLLFPSGCFGFFF